MRATWLTSALSGAIFGAIAASFGSREGALPVSLLVFGFLGTDLFGVFGVVQMKEMLEERKRRGLGFFGVLAESADLKHFYLPVWGRMLVWLIATGIGVVTVKSVTG